MPRKKQQRPAEIFARLNSVSRLYSPADIDEYLDTVGDLPIVTQYRRQHGQLEKEADYYNIPAAFDIETSSFEDIPDEAYAELAKVPEIYERLNGITISVDPTVWEDEELRFLRKSHRQIHIKPDGQPLDALWDHELSQEFPFAFPPDIVNPEDMLYAIYDALDRHKAGEQPKPEKVAIMYEWTVNVCGLTMIGRTWDEFLQLYDAIVKRYRTGEKTRFVFYVHNLAFEFQFIRTRFTWENVFALDLREPVKARTTDGIEFRCSYLLSGYSLALVGEHLTKYPVQKMVGDLDYSLIRHAETPLTEKEIGYCVNDCRVVVSYILEEIERNRGRIISIPLTKTGYVRRYCRKACMHPGAHDRKSRKAYTRYRDLMRALTITGADEYHQLKRAFAGGFTHCSAWYSGQTMEDVTSFDFTSSYPTVMVAERFPMSRAELIPEITKDEFEKSLRLYCCIFDVNFIGLRPKTHMEHFLSESKCFKIDGKYQPDNGRIVWADSVYTTLTDVDYKIMQRFYTWDRIRIANFRRYRRGYLPTDFVKAVLKLYADKTQLKGIAGKEAEYLNSKEMLNSCYGMMVTDPCRPEYHYNNEWLPPAAPDINDAIKQYNESSNRFLFYPWGVYVTAYARRNLLIHGVLPCGEDYIYSDTDSIKITNADAHRSVIESYNERITRKLQQACDWHGIPREALCPQTVKGVPKPLGVWDDDGTYTRFKSLGAKRYLVEKDGKKLSLTVSGLNKHIAIPYLISLHGRQVAREIVRAGGLISPQELRQRVYTRVFDSFDDELYIPAGYTGKNLHTYIDDELSGYVTDYTGTTAEYNERSGVHLSAAEYSLKIGYLYAQYIKGVRYEKE